MKKVLFFAVSILGSALLLTSCGDPNTGVGEVTGITITPSSYTLTLGDEPLRLSYTLTPNGASIKGINWTSSNEDVATVDKDGRVTALNTGEANITATVVGTDIKGICNIKVSTLEETLSFTEAYVGYIDYDSVNTVVYEHNQLGTINVHVAKGRIQLFTEGLYFNASGKLDGAKRGGWIYMNAPIALAYASENKENPNMAQYSDGVSFSLGSYAIDLEPADTIDVKWHHAHKGIVDNQKFMGYLNNWLTDFNKEGKFTQTNYENFAYAGIYGFSGASLKLRQYTTDEEGNSEYSAYPNWLWEYTPNAIATSGILSIGSEEGSSKYMHKIEYMDVAVRYVLTDTIGIPGVYMNTKDNQFVLNSTNVELGEEMHYQMGEIPANAPAGVEFFVDHIVPRVSANEYDGKEIALPNNKFAIK